MPIVDWRLGMQQLKLNKLPAGSAVEVIARTQLVHASSAIWKQDKLNNGAQSSASGCAAEGQEGICPSISQACQKKVSHSNFTTPACRGALH